MATDTQTLPAIAPAPAACRSCGYAGVLARTGRGSGGLCPPCYEHALSGGVATPTGRIQVQVRLNGRVAVVAERECDEFVDVAAWLQDVLGAVRAKEVLVVTQANEAWVETGAGDAHLSGVRGLLGELLLAIDAYRAALEKGLDAPARWSELCQLVDEAGGAA